MNGVIFLVKKHLKIFFSNILYPDRLTCFPDAPRKGRIRIAVDNLVWLLRFFHANQHYYLHGLDRKNPPHPGLKNIDALTGFRRLRRKSRRLNRYADLYDIVLHDKFVASRYLTSLGFPTPRALALLYQDSMLLPCSGRELPLSALADNPDDLFRDCICKPITDFAGRGIFSLRVDHGAIVVNGRPETIETFSRRVLDTRYLVEEKIVQHERMAKLNPHCVNTIRLATYLEGQTVRPFAAAVRLGTNRNVTDNWHTGGLIVRLDLETGCLGPHGVTHPDFEGKFHKTHPDTGEAFYGYAIPCWREALEMALAAHKYFYGTLTIGWDIAITPTGPLFIEANQGWDPYVFSVLEDRFVEKFAELLRMK